MALNCNTCKHKQNAVSNGHCSEFVHIPALDKCEMHTEGARAQAVEAAKPEPSGSYLWLGEVRTKDSVAHLNV